MDEFTNTFSKKIKDIEDSKVSFPKKSKFPSLSEKHKTIMFAVAAIFIVFAAFSVYVNHAVEKAIAKYDAEKSTGVDPQVDIKISNAINNYNTQIQPQIMDLHNKINAVHAPPAAAPVETVQQPHVVPAPATPKAVKTTKSTKPLKNSNAAKVAKNSKPAKRGAASVKSKVILKKK